MKEKSKRGGKRKGAGRPKELLEPTTPIRVPKSLAPFMRNRENWDAIAKLKDDMENG